MASFTILLKRVLELTDGDIGLNNYPIFDPNYRVQLNKRITDHFYNQEIGQESIPMFQLAMARHMNENMPYWNKLYKSEQITFDPLSTVNLRTFTTTDGVQTATSNAESSTLTDSNADSLAVQSETPQTILSRNADYATSAAESKSNSKATGSANETNSGTTNTDQESESTTTGYQGSASELLMTYRATLMNIDLMIIQQIEQAGLFMLVWGTGDDYTSNYLGGY